MKIELNKKKLISPTFLAFVAMSVVVLFISSLKSFVYYKKVVDNNLEFKFDVISIFFKNKVKEKLVYSESVLYQLIPHFNKNEIEEFHIFISQKDIDSLNSDLPKSGKSEYVKATLATISVDGKNNLEDEKIKIRYRGDNNYHWLYKQKSLRIKLENGIKLNLINPQHLFSIIDIASYNEARNNGLLAPKSYPIKVFMNNKYMGVYTFAEQIDENFLRDNKLMPGSIYFGDRTGFDENGLPTLWSDYRNWDKQASRNKDNENNIEDLVFFIDGVSKLENKDFFNFFNNYFDKEKVYLSIGIDTLFGSSIRDSRHNHKWYFDPYIGKYQPVIWDIRDWSVGARKDMSTYTFLKRIKSNPILEYQRDLTSYKNFILNKDETISRIAGDLDKINNSIFDYLAKDAYRDTAVWYANEVNNWISESFFMSEYKKSISDHKKILEDRINFLEKQYEKSLISINYDNYEKIGNSNYSTISIVVNGNSPVVTTFSKKINPIKDINLNLKLDQNDYLSDSEEILYPGRKKIFDMPPNFNGYRLEPSSLVYTFFIKKKISDVDLGELISFKNAITGDKVNATYVDNLPINEETISIHPWILPEYEEKTITLSGNQYISSDKVYDKYTTVNILPGTTFYLDPDASLFFYGKVIAKGTNNQPIKFLPSIVGKPFGSIVLQGQKTAGSILENIQIEKGSITTHNLINYTAQLNIHDTKDISIRNCFVGENFVGDDSLHLAYVDNALIDNCVFSSARSDAVDIDISQVELKNNLFINSGNDLLDFMTSEATVKDNVFINSGDKGISVGEWSNITIDNNFFYSNLIGIEVKDKSDVNFLRNNLIASAKVAPINLYNKNKFYDRGGRIEGKKIYIIGENNKITKDKKSKNKIKEVMDKFPAIENFKFLNKLTNIDEQWSNLENEMKALIRKYPL